MSITNFQAKNITSSEGLLSNHMARNKHLSERFIFDMELKYCCGCKKERPFEDFHKSKNQKFGLAVHCKDCCLERGKNIRQSIS